MLQTKRNAGRRKARPKWCTNDLMAGSAAERVARLASDPRLRRASELPPLAGCPGCGGRVFDRPLGEAATFAARECADCGRAMGLVPADADRAKEWGLGYRLRSGRFAGRSLGELSRTARGRDLLRWLVEGAGSDDLRRAARIVVEDMDAR